MSGVPFRGVSSNSDARFTDKERKLMKSMKFPKEYEQKVEFAKVNFEALKPWIAKRVTELLGIEDEVLVGYIYEQFEGVKSLDPRILQINLTGFLEKNTSLFVKELWMLMVSAKDTASGIPQQLLDEAAAEQKRRRDLQESINSDMAARQEKRNAELRAARAEEEREREERRRQREKQRQEDMERERKRRAKEREEYERDLQERKKRREEILQKERERDRERRKEYEARQEEYRRRDYGRDRDLGRHRDRDDGAYNRQDRREPSRLEVASRGVRNDTRQRSDSASPTPPPEAKRARENGEARDAPVVEPKAKKIKKEKKEKKPKKEKKEKKEKKAKVKREASASPSGRTDSDASLHERRSLEDDLRRKALLSVKTE